MTNLNIYPTRKYVVGVPITTETLLGPKVVGMVLAVDAADADRTMEAIRAAGESPYVVGRIEAGEKGVDLC